MFVSPTEPSIFADTLGWVVSSLPEDFGVDFMWSSPMGKVGIQRKEFPGDFISSVRDGRLGGEAFGKMAQLDVAVLLLEGRDRWTSEGHLIYQYGTWTRTQHRNFLSSVQARGVQVQTTDDKFDTVQFLRDFYIYTHKERHSSTVNQHVKAQGSWGHVSNKDYQVHMLSSLPGINSVLAEAIINTLGFPLRLNVTEDALLLVPGIGKGRAGKIAKVFREVREGQGAAT